MQNSDHPGGRNWRSKVCLCGSRLKCEHMRVRYVDLRKMRGLGWHSSAGAKLTLPIISCSQMFMRNWLEKGVSSLAIMHLPWGLPELHPLLVRPGYSGPTQGKLGIRGPLPLFLCLLLHLWASGNVELCTGKVDIPELSVAAWWPCMVSFLSLVKEPSLGAEMLP